MSKTKKVKAWAKIFDAEDIVADTNIRLLRQRYLINKKIVPCAITYKVGGEDENE